MPKRHPPPVLRNDSTQERPLEDAMRRLRRQANTQLAAQDFEAAERTVRDIQRLTQMYRFI